MAGIDDEKLIELAWNRFEECCDSKRTLSSNSGIIIGVDSIIIGLLVNYNINITIFISLCLLFVSAFISLTLLTGLPFKSIHLHGFWEDAQNQEDQNAYLYSTISEIVDTNQEKMNWLWIQHNRSIAFLITSLFFLLIGEF